MRSPSTEANHSDFHKTFVSMMQFICLKQLRDVMTEIPMVTAMLCLCMQMIKGSYFSSCAWLSLCWPI